MKRKSLAPSTTNNATMGFKYHTNLIHVQQSDVHMNNIPANMAGVKAIKFVKNRTKLCAFEGHVVSQAEFDAGKR
jgi:hypothetical protein